MNLHDWIDELCDALDIEVELDEALILDLARDAAHNVARPAAPLTTFLLGLAAGQRGANTEEIERLAGVASELASNWDQPAGSGDPDVPDAVDDEEIPASGADIFDDRDPDQTDPDRTDD